MISTIGISLLIGILAGNAVPHFIKGITKENYACLLGNGAIPNFIAGWIFLNITGILIYFCNFKEYPLIAFSSCSVGIFLIGLFHAGPGAFGRKEK
jgi:hypothetical protein